MRTSLNHLNRRLRQQARKRLPLLFRKLRPRSTTGACRWTILQAHLRRKMTTRESEQNTASLRYNRRVPGISARMPDKPARQFSIQLNPAQIRGFSMSIPATQMRPGMIIKHNNDLHTVFSVEHRTPGNFRAFIQAKLRNVRTGAMFVDRLLPIRSIASSLTR